MKTTDAFVPTRLPDGKSFRSWEKPLKFTRTYFVDGQSPATADTGPGTRARPFKTISRAAEVLMPGEQVVIAEGIYRETVAPARGGTGPDKMISYEAAPGANVVIKGSVLLDKGWKPSTGWSIQPRRGSRAAGTARIWEISLRGLGLDGYNPFGIANVLEDRFWLDTKKLDMGPFFRRRGMLFVDGHMLTQVDLPFHLAEAPGRFWIEHNGLTLHMRLPDDGAPDRHEIEAVVREQAFAPRERFLGYIRVKGLHLMYAANGFPVPQRGLVSTYRGHHWVIEDNVIEWANAVGLDAGKECWHATDPGVAGHHVIRGNTIRHCGMCGIAAITTDHLLVEDNLIEHVGYQNAEYMYESAGIKVHHARNMLFRRNIVRHIEHACGIWMDCGNDNCRVTGNVFADIASITGGIHIEGTHGHNQVDNNIVANMRTVPRQDGTPGHPVPPGDPMAPSTPGCGGKGIYIQGTDSTIIAHNLVMDCEAMGFRCDIVPHRIIDTHGGTAINNQVLNNIFIRTGRSAIEFESPHRNKCDGNVFVAQPAGFLRVDAPPFPQILDLASWREIHGWDRHGQEARITASFDGDGLTLDVAVEGKLAPAPVVPTVDTDFSGRKVKGPRPVGPLAKLAGKQDIDPRKPGLMARRGRIE